MRREPLVPSEPRLDLGCLVRGRVVADDVRVEPVGHAAVDQVQEPAELDRAVLIGHLRDHLARRNIERGAWLIMVYATTNRFVARYSGLTGGEGVESATMPSGPCRRPTGCCTGCLANDPR